MSRCLTGHNVRIMACMSRALYAQAVDRGHVEPLIRFGVEFIHDTCWCMLLDPPIIPSDRSASILTNSGKYAHYGPGLVQRSFRFGSTDDCVRAAISGSYPRQGLSRRDALPHFLSPLESGVCSASPWSSALPQVVWRFCAANPEQREALANILIHPSIV